jgi:predicted DNA-binding transcriptional regulator YafY
MLETSARLLRLLSLLQTPRDWTGAELAERLGVSGRTVRTDVERLRTLGYPVVGTRGAVGGYRLGAGASLPPLLLDDEEAVAVTVGLRTTAAGGAIAGIEEASLRALAKLEQVLPSRLRRRVSTLQTYTVPVPRGDAGPVVDPELLSTLAAACRDREGLRFDYDSHSGTGSRREAEPYRLVNWGRRWYLLAFDLGRNDWRTFRADRIRLRTPNNPRFTPRELPTDDVAAYVSGRVSAAAWRHTAAVTVRAPAEVVAERINPAVGTVESIDDRTCVLHTGADSVETLAVHLGLLDQDFEVTGPPELVAYLTKLTARYAASVPSAASPPGPARRRPSTTGRARR